MMDELKRGTILAWRDPPCVNADSVQSVQADAAGGMPGVLQPRRAFPDALTASQEGNALRPRQDLVISSCISYNTDPDYTLCGVYEATSGAARVIVKLFIDVVDWDAVDWDSTYYDQFTYTGCPELDAVHEVRSYRRMRALQGSIVPYSLGFYKFTVEGNIYLGHVMEDVTVGTGLDDIEEQIRSDEPGGWGRDLRFPLPLLLTRLFRSIIEIHKCDVVHGDIGFHNTFMADRDGTPDFVFIDFSDSILLSVQEARKYNWRSIDYDGAQEIGLGIQPEFGDYWKWEESEEGNALVELSRMTPDEMPEEERAHRFFVELQETKP